MKRKVAEIILILLFYLIQVTFGNAIGIGGITPNLLIILPVLFGFFKGRNEGMLVGFLSGVMYDLFFSSLFGFSALVFVYIGYFSGIFYKEYEKVEVLIPLAMIMASDFVFEFLITQQAECRLLFKKIYYAGGCVYISCSIGIVLSFDEVRFNIRYSMEEKEKRYIR